MAFWHSLAALLVAACLALGCSSGEGSGSGGSCASVCQQSISLGCTTKTNEQCTSDCGQSLAKYPAQCQPPMLAMLSCALDSLGCNIGSGAEIVQACPSETTNMAGCMACEPESGDDACDSCQKSNCCAERKALYSDSSAVAFSECMNACIDTACSQGCLSQYPSVSSKTEALVACTDNKCASVCP